MFLFTCEWLDEQTNEGRSGFDLGHMTLESDKGICTSRGKSPDQAMMLAIAISDLFYGLELLIKGIQSEYRFIGTDSSFSVRFRKKKKGLISVQCGSVDLGEFEAKILCKSIYLGVESFITQAGNQLPENDPVYDDLSSSIQRFRLLLATR